jgi:hypothetical protein
MMLQSATVDWTRGKVRLRHVKGRTRRETIYPAVCPNCGRERWLKKADALKAEQQRCLCYHCAQSEKGRLGWLATANCYGTHFALKYVREYRLQNPSVLEIKVMNWLTQLDLPYEREVWFEAIGQVYLIDFVVNSNYAIEVNGEYVHRHRRTEDQAKYAAIREQYPLLVLEESQVDCGLAWEQIERHILYGVPQ